MRERQSLEDGIKAVKGVSQALEDNIGLIQLGEEEGDQSVVEEAEAAIRSLAGVGGILWCIATFVSACSIGGQAKSAGV